MSSPATASAPRDDASFTQLLHRARGGDERAKSQLFAALYSELRARAARIARQGNVAENLQPTALVHEAYIKLSSAEAEKVADRTHYLLIASRAMRQVLVDHRRAQNALRRSAAGVEVPFDDIVRQFEEQLGDLDKLDVALEKLAHLDADMVRAIDLRFFSGLSVADTASALGMSVRTFERHWNLTRAWLALQIRA